MFVYICTARSYLAEFCHFCQRVEHLFWFRFSIIFGKLYYFINSFLDHKYYWYFIFYIMYIGHLSVAILVCASALHKREDRILSIKRELNGLEKILPTAWWDWNLIEKNSPRIAECRFGYLKVCSLIFQGQQNPKTEPHWEKSQEVILLHRLQFFTAKDKKFYFIIFVPHIQFA